MKARGKITKIKSLKNSKTKRIWLDNEFGLWLQIRAKNLNQLRRKLNKTVEVEFYNEASKTNNNLIVTEINEIHRE